MITFQFDKCFNDRKVVKSCNEQGFVTARRLDREMYDAEDPVLLRHYMAKPNPLITTDRALPGEHSGHIPDVNPGLVIVAYSKYCDETKQQLKTMTTGAAAKILKNFKEGFPAWHTTAVNNLIVEITDKYIQVAHVKSGQLVTDLFLEFAKLPNWRDLLSEFFQAKQSHPNPAIE